MRLTDARIQHLLMVDPRETKQAVWMQDSVNGLRAALKQALEELTTVAHERPAAGSAVQLDIGRDEDRYVGLGDRARVRIVIGDETWPKSGEPKHYIEVEAGRRYQYGKAAHMPQPVTHVTLRASHGTLIMPAGSATNVAEVHIWGVEPKIKPEEQA